MELKIGQEVIFQDCRRKGKNGKRIYVPIFGTWDGEKATFTENLEPGTTEIVVRNPEWLEIK